VAASNLTLRFGTAAVMIPLLLALLYAGPAWGWLLFLLAIAVVGAHEIFGMTHPGDKTARLVGIALTWGVCAAIWAYPYHPDVLLAAVLVIPTLSILFTLWRLGEMPTAALRVSASSFGPLWVGAGIGAIGLLRLKGGGDGASYVVVCLGLAWGADTGAYFAGRFLGKHKLYEAVSPKKTVEGMIGGVVAASALMVGMHYVLLPSLPIRDAVILGAVGSVMGALGDLGESVLKRSVKVKDSGGIWPGHGGMLDRIDAVVITAPVTLLYVVLVQGSGFQSFGW
jgi:phosphatidate cytidylyltransferase